MQFISDMQLLRKAAREKNSREYSKNELKRLAILLDLEKLFENFSEKDLRAYRDEYSGQSIFGRKFVKNSEGETMFVSFIPTDKSSRCQLYEGMIFSIINPAVRNLAKILFEFQPSDYAKMSYALAIAWASLSEVLTAVKAWAEYIDIVVSPGAIISPMMGYHDTSNLMMINNLIFSTKLDLDTEMSKLFGEFEFA